MDETTEENSARGADGRFRPGHSGNPAGKPKGTRHRLTVLRELVEAGEDETAGRRFIARALSGKDDRAETMFVQHIFPKPRGRHIQLDLPEGKNAADDVALLDATIAEMAAGIVTIDEALMVARLVESRRRAREAAAAEQRARAARAEAGPGAVRSEGRTPRAEARAAAAPAAAKPAPALGGVITRQTAALEAAALRRQLLNSTCISRAEQARAADFDLAAAARAAVAERLRQLPAA